MAAGSEIGGNSQGLTVAAGFLGFLVFFAVMWVSVLWLISRLGGWAGLARQFPGHGAPEGIRYPMCSLRLGLLGSYNNCMTVTLSRDGIHLIPILPFRFAHEPLLIPWRCVEKTGTGNFFFRWCTLTIRAGGKSLRLYLPASAADWMSANRLPPGASGPPPVPGI